MKSPQDEPTVSPSAPSAPSPQAESTPVEHNQPAIQPREIGGRDGPEPTRFGDWEKAGRCIDF